MTEETPKLEIEEEEIEKQQKQSLAMMYILGIGIAFLVMGSVHWSMIILGVIFILAFGWLMFDKARKKEINQKEDKNE